MFLRQLVAIITSSVRQYQSRQRIEKRQQAQLREMLALCKGVPHYKEALRNVDMPCQIVLDKLPILEKDDLRHSQPTDFLVPGTPLDEAEYFVTSGSTGKRVEGYHDRISHDYHTGALVRRFLATGRYSPIDRLTHLKPYPTPQKLYEKFGLFRRHVVNSFEPMPKMIEQTLANRPHVLLGIPTYIREFIRECSAEQIACLRQTLRAVFTESELLTAPHRRFIEDSLGVPVFDEYSAFEALNIYYECSHGGRHIAEDRICVEILDDADQPVADGTEGHIVVTPFTERAMPLLRYRIGDYGKINRAPCTCGRTFKTMEITKGRTNDRIKIGEGRYLYWADVVLVMMGLENALDCHVRQLADGFVQFFFVPRHQDATEIAATSRSIALEMYAKIGHEFPLAAIPIDQIPKTPGGKGHLVYSELSA